MRYTQKISADLQYKKGSPSERRYDSCYYEIGADTKSLAKLNSYNISDSDIFLHLEITNAVEMNVYIYSGTDR